MRVAPGVDGMTFARIEPQHMIEAETDVLLPESQHRLEIVGNANCTRSQNCPIAATFRPPPVF